MIEHVHLTKEDVCNQLRYEGSAIDYLMSCSLEPDSIAIYVSFILFLFLMYKIIK